MVQYAYFDPLTGRVHDWLDTAAHTYELPPANMLIACSAEQWASRDQDMMVLGGTLQPWVSSAPALTALRSSKLAVLSAACAAAITGGFTSTALGAPHRYPSQQTDQINLMGSVTASLLPDVGSSWATPFWCADAAGVWDFRMHSAEQIQAAGADGKGFVVACQTLLADLSEQVGSAGTVAALDHIVWVDPA